MTLQTFKFFLLVQQRVGMWYSQPLTLYIESVYLNWLSYAQVDELFFFFVFFWIQQHMRVLKLEWLNLHNNILSTSKSEISISPNSNVLKNREKKNMRIKIWNSDFWVNICELLTYLSYVQYVANVLYYIKLS